MYLKKVIIKNFRSIEFAEIELGSLNIFVGLNDAGKSNLLKALNLFFNNETDLQTPYRFENDYCFTATHREKMAKEIVITLIIQPPSNYSNKEDIRWRKVWRREGRQASIEKDIMTVTGNGFLPRSKIFSWLNNLSYRYVPAVKSDAYFQNLLGDLHDTLALTISEKLKDAGIDFIGRIKESTSDISLNINKRLGFASEIQLPNNLKELFKTLDFNTGNGTFDVSLQRRGDGIKTRHIPVILHFLAEQENKVKSKGSPRVNTIWGYEEPENNLEMLKSFELADEFLDYSKNIQILVSTHSPAFYSLASSKLVRAYVAEQGNGKTVYHAVELTKIAGVDSQMGIMPIIAPYIQEEVAKQKVLMSRIGRLQEEINAFSQANLFVEGVSDKIVLDAYVEKFPFKKPVTISVSQEEGGAIYVHDMVVAWSYSKNRHMGMGLFDKDEAGSKYRRECMNNLKVQSAMRQHRAALIELNPPSHLHLLFHKQCDIPISIEELCPLEVWLYAEKKNWLEPRSDLRSRIRLNIPNDKTLSEVLDEQGLSEEQTIFLFNKVKESSKIPFALHVAGEIKVGNIGSDIFSYINQKVNSLLRA